MPRHSVARTSVRAPYEHCAWSSLRPHFTLGLQRVEIWLALAAISGRLFRLNDVEQHRRHVPKENYRSHDIPNLFVCDGSSLVTSGRGQPTMTIQALAFHAGEHIARFAKRGEI